MYDDDAILSMTLDEMRQFAAAYQDYVNGGVVDDSVVEPTVVAPWLQ